MPFSLRVKQIALAVLSVIIVTASASATTPLTAASDSLWGSPDGALSPAVARQLFRADPRQPIRDIRETLVHFHQTCTFLDSMQEHDPESGSFGGLHEGEGDQLWAIIETDNTQEAIRVWCEYADYFGDPDRFRANVEDAWTYCDNYPAWEESEPDGFYAMHNAGWGLIATIGYRHAYDESRDDYGQRCAEHLIENVPEITVNMQDNLMPLVAGWSAGTLYEYGLEIGNRDYQTEAIRIALQVKAWIAENPERLNRNEIWALCGGTAMWGVIRTLAREDDNASEWMPGLLENMDVIAGGGNWNVSWNIWYAHAWLAAYEFFDDADYIQNAETIIDSLLALDTDDDGGIPATIGDANNRDQAWVSAYTAWMLLRNLFDNIPEVDVELIAVLAPSNNRPWPVGSQIPFVLKAQQNGTRGVVSDIPLHIVGDWTDRQSFNLQGWEPRETPLERNWLPDEIGEARISFIAEYEGDADHENDFVQFSITIRDTGSVVFGSTSRDEGQIAGTFFVENLEFPGIIPPFTVEVRDQLGFIEMPLMEGLYRATFRPRFPYPIVVFDSVVVDHENELRLINECEQPQLLIINNDTDSTRERFIADPLNSLKSPFRLWRNTDGEVPFIDGFAVILYYTGNRAEDVIPEDDQNLIIGANAHGFSVLVTGQNIAEDLAGSDFLENTLHARILTENTRSRQVLGLAGDEVLSGTRMLLLGNQGAANQSSTDGIEAIGSAMPCALYSDRGDTAAAIRWGVDAGARGIFCSFGIEAISGSGGTTSRAEFLERALTWLGVDMRVGLEDVTSLPASPLLIYGYPNPFNSSIKLYFSRNMEGGKMGISICDMLGRVVTSNGGVTGDMWVWNGVNSEGIPVSAGTYFVTLNSQQFSGALPPALKVTLVR